MTAPSYDRNPQRMGRSIALATLGTVWLWLGAAEVGALTVTFQDVNPNNSTLDPTDPDGASGGRTNGLGAVAGNNQVFYAATEWGGLYRTNDAGVTWNRLDGHLPVATWDVEVDPSNANRVYATSWFDGRVNSISGIQVSADGGTTWAHPATATPPAAFNCAAARRTQPAAFGIGIQPGAPQNVVVGTNCGVAISTDSGVNWNFVDPTPADTATDVWDVLVQAGGIIDVCGDDGHLRSTDGGANWVAGAGLPAGRCSLAASPDENYVLLAAASDNNLYETDNANAAGGATWTNRGTPDASQGRVPFVATNDRAGTAFDLWFGDVSLRRGACTTPAMPAPGGAFRCPAGGGAWAGPFTRSVGAHDDVGDIAFDTAVAPDACPRIFSSDGGVYRNTDVGADCQNPNWEQPNVTPHALWLYAMDGSDVAGAAAEDLYMGLQDNGTFATQDAGNAAPAWFNRDCCDSFDILADAIRVISSLCCGWSLRFSNPGMVGTANVNGAPPGGRRTFQFPDWIDRFGNNQYIAANATGAFFTNSITANPVVWTQLGAATTPAGGFCAVRASVTGGTPTFYANTRCITPNGSIFESGPGSGQLWRFDGTNAAGTWQRIDNNDGLQGGIEAFSAAPTDPNLLYALNQAPAGPRVVFSTDGGQNWDPDPELDALMTGNGAFLYQPTRGATPIATNQGYTQTTFFEYDPANTDVIVSGGRDSGLFLSVNAGQTWRLLTDPLTSNTSGVPHLPRPWFAYFETEAGDPAGHYDFFVGTQGRGAWRVTVDNQPPVCDANGPYVAECQGATTNVTLDGTGSSDPDADPLTFTWTGPFVGGTAAGAMPNVTFAGTGNFSVDLEVSDSLENATCSAAVTVQDTIPPTVTCSVATSLLWPPSHDLIDVGFAASATDICAGNLPVTVEVFADEDDEEATGDGNHSPDAKIRSNGALVLRSERKGNEDGRVYLIRAQATDPANLTDFDCCTVAVPHQPNAKGVAAVNAQAAAAEAACDPNGTIPAGFVSVGDGPVLGPKQ